MTGTIAVAVWLILLALAFPYVRRARHPQSKTLAAFLLFVTLFSVVGATLFYVLTGVAVALGRAEALNNPLWALLLVAMTFIPAFLAARWIIKRPPWDRPVPK
jgi:prolipoprotein diacylglyceryltransferase